MRPYSGMLAVGLVAGSLAAAGGAPVSPDQARLWLDYCIPLPHEIKLDQAVPVQPAELGIVIATNAGVIEKQAAADLRGLIQSKTGVAPTGATFEIVLGIVDAQGQVAGRAVTQAGRLSKLPNANQAYLIQPQGENRLVVAALDARGVYYGVQTVRQLLEGKITRATVTVPLATVVDWPDLDERGMWNVPYESAPWFSALKLNFLILHCGLRIEKGRPVEVNFDRKLVEQQWSHAMRGVIELTHLNYWNRNYRLYQVYPDLVGRGDKAVPGGAAVKAAGRDIPVPCATNPQWKKLITEALLSLGAQGAREVSVWLSEFEGQCQCENCLKTTQVQQETKIVLEAWQEAHRQYPGLVLRLFFSLGDDTPATEAAIASLPPEVKIERVYAFLKPFRDAAARGRWMVAYTDPMLSLQGWHLRYYADDIHKCLQTVYANHLQGAFPMGGCGLNLYPVPAYFQVIYDYFVSALAEWSWNIKGRDRREFVRAWATRQGYDQPEKVADWSDAVETVTRRLKLSVGYGVGANPHTPFQNVPAQIRARSNLVVYSPATLTNLQALCRQALPAVETLNKPNLAVETRYLLAFLDLHEKLNQLSERLTRLDLSQAASKEKVREAGRAVQAAIAALIQARETQINLWQAEPKSFIDTVKADNRKLWQGISDSIGAAIADLLSGQNLAARPVFAVRAPRVTGAAALDGFPDDPVWQKSGRIEGFLDRAGQPAGAKTEVRIGRDDANLYVAYLCADSQPAEIRHAAAREAEVTKDDCVAVLLQPDRNQSNHVQLILSAGGVRFDQLSTADKRDTENYNPEWKAAARVTATGWVAELAIPFSALGLTNVPAGAVWGANFGRVRWVKGQTDGDISSWTGSADWHQVNAYGQLTLE